jgi:CHAT domain-containing protein
MPPPVHGTVRDVAVVVGDYLAERGLRPLPKAQDEGRRLVKDYAALELTATESQVLELLRDRLERDGAPAAVDAIHFACHGQIDVNNPLYNGIVLDDGITRLDQRIIAGALIGERRQPFVFLNACQVGTADTLLGDYGGMAAAFLRTGFRGFVAPLWNVDDQIAHDVALDFYEQVLGAGCPVAEGIRRVRSRFSLGTEASRPPAASFMAYVFYGHPELVLERA